MLKSKTILNFKIAVSLLLIAVFINCIESNSGKVPPLFTASVTPYTPGDLGIPTPPANSPLATLPAISNSERAAIEEAFQMMSENGQLDQKFVKESSIASRDLLMNRPLTDTELEARVEAELKGETYPVPSYGSEQAILEKESQAADAFYGRVASDLPSLTIPELVKARENFTLSLVMIRFMMDYGTIEKGIPTSFLMMAREKAVAIRQKVNEELIKRGVTTL